MTLFDFLLANQSFSLQIGLRTCPSQQKSPTNRSAGVQSDQNNSQKYYSAWSGKSISRFEKIPGLRIANFGQAFRIMCKSFFRNSHIEKEKPHESQRDRLARDTHRQV